MPIFAPDGSFVWSGVRAFRERWVALEAGLALVLGVTEVCRRTRVIRRGRSVGPVDRFAVRVVAVRPASPERVAAAAFDVPRERFELVVVLACARRGLVLERA